MQPHLSRLSELRGLKDHPWVQFLQQHPREKLRLLHYVADTAPALSPAVADVIQRFEKTGLVSAGSVGLVTYCGFRQDVCGWLYRDLNTKLFLTEQFFEPLIYVAQAFEDRLSEFQFGDPIVLAEGILDAECVVEMSGFPYVLAYLRSAVSVALMAWLSLLTRRVIVIPDNDAAGEKGVGQNNRKIDWLANMFGVQVQVLRLFESKDAGDVQRWSVLDSTRQQEREILRQRVLAAVA